MTDKVQKIKDWICREQDGLMDAQGNFENPSDEGAFHILTNLDYYIDSLQEEPASEEIGNYNHTAVLEGLGYQSKEEPVISNVNVEPIGVSAGVVELANVPDRKEYPVSEDLEEAIEDTMPDCNWRIDDVGDEVYEDAYNSIQMANMFKAGANWQKEQIIKNATKVTVHIDAGNYPYIPQIELYDYDKDVPLAKEGDKYKVVLIKKD